ncbi:MAG: hypothetical protein UR39_C0004G0053 [Candidatus Woesebacteria bacterium GW2011_GWA1_33_30]|uniref:Uncharacterized protein n=1 Tax=Candidatus Woesebacteria bacterium GW2011_GWA2_33_28 TaxID=1618561 RepID=A0A0G0CVQ8_9BACT|nr:MAG: hypothetical protein UR38_C0004G0020 [Candidatus Woesebacteria bacterium GW2011_GWA2_33_28]KKP48432.1 MAG: hypothetical protein UR39_C0004G0053 [Candidatus Woesebacteria bacterium GW2011_GWA1_33_30]KKP49539.1 MAG: hypothetical protein UR40_C0005G0053 [Microgenomates group bacterium GW2011_GWC1_33_32]KKP52504.1 MAG: hypothetical protein UR44_C0002G0053 [Candidatus Woesebacteria bacterium GW2011_GWB1_33_38]KKP58362.1 MAG: hypothetical protein UR48_C0005G0040 [Microgenomates group bacteriu
MIEIDLVKTVVGAQNIFGVFMIIVLGLLLYLMNNKKIWAK